MPALSAPDAATWRTSPYKYTPYLWIDRPTTVFAARVNQASFTFPLAQLTFDTVTTGAYTDLIGGMTVLIGSSAGADDLGRTYVRPYKSATSTIIYIGESSQGVRDGEVNPADNAYITVLNEFRIWSAAARFNSSKTQFKYYDLQVSAGGRNYGENPGPIANGGCFRADLVDSVSNVATFSFSASDSIAFTSGSTISSYLWGVGDGTITVGTTTSSSITATFPVGRRYVSLRVQDSNGHQHTTYILVLALDVDDATYKPIRDFDITEDRDTAFGKTMTFVVHEGLTTTTYPEGTTVIYFEKEKYGTTAGSLAGPDTAEHVKFVGWLDTSREEPESTFKGIERGTEFRCISSAERLRQINVLPQLVKYKASGSADEWDELNGLTPSRLWLYLLLWHTTANLCCPIIVDALDSNVKRWATTASDVWSQVTEVARSRCKYTTCDKRGILRLITNPQVIEVASRTSTVIVALTGADYDKVRVERNRAPRIYWLDGKAITLGTSKNNIKPLFCIAPGDAPGQGPARNENSELVVSDQTQLNAWIGHDYARVNSFWPHVTVRLTHTGDAGIDPALMEWCTLTVASSTNRRGLSLTTQRVLPIEVNVVHSNDFKRTKEVEITFEVETSGTPATTVTISDGGAGIPSETPLPEPIDPGEPGEGGYFPPGGMATMAAFTTGGHVYMTSDFDTPSVSGGPTWTDVDLGITGFVQMWTCDPWSPGYLGTGTEVNGWLLTNEAVYRLTDLFGSWSIASQYTLPINADTGDIIAPWGQQNWVIGHVYYGNNSPFGSHCIYTTDGTNWNHVPISTHYSNLQNARAIYGSSRIPGTAWAIAFSATGAGAQPSQGYKTTNHGATWVADASLDAGDLPANLHIAWHDNANQLIAYFLNRITIGVPDEDRLWRRNADGSISDISPVDTTKCGPRSRQWATYCSPNNRQIVLCCAHRVSGDREGVFLSRDAGNNWTALIVPSSTNDYVAGCIGGDNDQIIYLWGTEGAIGYSSDQGATIDSRMGNISTLTEIVAIAGGPVTS